MAQHSPATPAGWTGRFLGSEGFAVGLCLMAFAAFAPVAPGFVSTGNLENIVLASLPLLLLAVGQTVVLIAGGIDLSVTAIVGVVSILGSWVMSAEHGWLAGHAAAAPIAGFVMLGAGALVGLFNGTCIAGLRMPAFMVTLTSMMFFGGLAVWLAQRVAGTETLHQLPDAFVAWGRYPALAFGMAFAATLLAHLLLKRTLPGRWLYALGASPRVARISGVPVGGVLTAAYVFSGMFAALASILITARLETGSATHGRALLLDVIGAAVLGGTSLLGGRGRVLGTVFGVFFLTLLSNGLNLLNVSDFLTTLVKGAVILVAAVLDVWRTRGLRAV